MDDDLAPTSKASKRVPGIRALQRLVRSAPLFRGKHRLAYELWRRLGFPEDEPWARLPNGAKMYVSAFTRPYFWYIGVYEPEVTPVFIRMLRDSDPQHCFVDVGANEGYYTLVAAQHLRRRCVENGGKVFAFEPHPFAFDRLRKNISLNGLDNVVAVNAAVGDYLGQTTLHASDQEVALSSIRPVQDALDHPFTVDILTLDGFFGLDEDIELPQMAASGPREAAASARVSMIKMDIQGAELLALRGARRLLERDRPILILEEWPAGYQRFGYSVEALKTYLGELEYGFFTLRMGRLRWSVMSPADQRLPDCSFREEDYVNLLCVPREKGASI